MLIHRPAVFKLIDDIYSPIISSFISTLMNKKETYFANYFDNRYLVCLTSFHSLLFHSILFYSVRYRTV